MISKNSKLCYLKAGARVAPYLSGKTKFSKNPDFSSPEALRQKIPTLNPDFKNPDF